MVVKPDAPPRGTPTWRSFTHWLQGNILGNNISQSESIWGFIGCGPPQGSGFHRYIYVVFKHPGRIDYSGIVHRTSRNIDGRGGFSVRDFAKKYKLGTPITANYFLAQWDESVPKLYATFTDHDPTPSPRQVNQ